MESNSVDSLKGRFSQLHGGLLRVFRAPGRVNLIGEHTDYNDGFVMPIAIGMAAFVAMSPRPDRKLHVHSDNFNESLEIDLAQLGTGRTRHWSDYVRGVAGVLRSSGVEVKGANLLIEGYVPVGAGLSSSAALEVSVCMALLAASGVEMNRTKIAHICQQAEHEFAGTQCGIMDQYASCFGAKGNALLLDCRSLEHELLPIPGGVEIAVCNTNVTHKLGEEYNARRADCEEAVRHYRNYVPTVSALRDVNIPALHQHRNGLGDTVFRRARHVVSEIARVQQACKALKVGNLEQFGQLMYDSHRSLREDYEVSCAELDIMVDLAREVPGVYGARMTGGGFGGCIVALVESDAVDTFKSKMESGYKAKTNITPDIYICQAAEGACEV